MKKHNFWDSTKELAQIQKNKTEKIVISLCSRNDIEYIDIRIHRTSYGDDKFLPTEKGICLSIDLWNDVKSIIDDNINV